MRNIIFLMLAAPVLAGCQAPMPRATDAPPSCAAGVFEGAAVLPLPPASPPEPVESGKSAPLRFATPVPVRGGVGDIGRWDASASGWSVWRLRLSSENATSLSVHVYPMSLPDAAALWVCAPDGTVRHGPYRATGPAGTGHLWSPLVPGPVLGLEVVSPTGSVPAVKLQIEEAFVGFR